METQTRVIESDVREHLEDTRLYWTFRHGKQLQRSWNELTATEKVQQIEAQQRAAYNVLFAPCGGAEW